MNTRKFLLLLTIVLFGYQISYSMENDNSIEKKKYEDTGTRTITKPYKPGFSARHPILTSTIKASCLIGGAGYLLGNYAQDTIKPMYYTACGFLAVLGGYLYAINKKVDITDAILTNPLRGLNNAYAVQHKFNNELRKKDIDNVDTNVMCEEYKKAVKKFEKQNPIFLLGECTSEGFWDCILSRSYQPKNREAFEEKVISALLKKLNTLNHPVQYVDFGTGGMYQALVNVAKTLAQKPDANICVHLIDTKFTPYSDCRNLLNDGREVQSNYMIDAKKVMHQFKEIGKKQGLDDKPEKEVEKILLIETEIKEYSFKQFLSYLKQTYPLAQVSLHIHGNTDDYLSYLTQYNIPQADVITTADIEDEMSLMQASGANYERLCVKALQANSTSKNIWLGKNYNKADLRKISLNSTNDSIKDEFEIEQNNIIPLYIKSQTINPGWFGKFYLTKSENNRN